MSIQRTSLTADIWLVEISGRLDQDQAPLLENELTQLIQDAQYHLIVDLSQVDYINSAGLRCLVGTWRKAREQGGNLWLTGLNDRLKEVFSMVGFDKVFQIYPTISAAQEALLKTGEADE
ncbi:MAG: STAS domain-containing protein [Chloroflexi bacterium]|nr:STAS domain-containing protein [Chloroflexota bacterium]